MVYRQRKFNKSQSLKWWYVLHVFCIVSELSLKMWRYSPMEIPSVQLNTASEGLLITG